MGKQGSVGKKRIHMREGDDVKKKKRVSSGFCLRILLPPMLRRADSAHTNSKKASWLRTSLNNPSSDSTLSLCTGLPPMSSSLPSQVVLLFLTPLSLSAAFMVGPTAWSAVATIEPCLSAMYRWRARNHGLVSVMVWIFRRLGRV